MNADPYSKDLRPRFDVQSARLATGGRAGRQERRSSSVRAGYRRILENLKRLHAMLAELEAYCGRIAVAPDRTETHFEALHQFKGLAPLFEEVQFFIMVIGTHAEDLDERKRRNVDAQLDLLRRRLARLHLKAAAPLLRLVEQRHEPLPLGIRYVLERWLTDLDRMEQDLAPDRGAADWPALAALLEELRHLSVGLHQRAPDLPDFDVGEPPSEAPALPPLLPGHPPALPPHPALTSSGPEPVRLVLRRQAGQLFVDGRSSGHLMAEVRRLGLGNDLAEALGIQPGLLVMLLNGHDPIPAERLEAMVQLLRRSLAETGFELIDA